MIKKENRTGFLTKETGRIFCHFYKRGYSSGDHLEARWPWPCTNNDDDNDGGSDDNLFGFFYENNRKDSSSPSPKIPWQENSDFRIASWRVKKQKKIQVTCDLQRVL